MNPLIKKLKHLQNVAPRSEWKERDKAALLSEISKNVESTAPQAAFGSQQLDVVKSSFSFILPSHQTLQMLKPAGALFSLSLLVLSSGIFTVSASQGTLPGDTLYSIKLATERFQRVLTTNEQEKAKLEISFAGKRIEELERIVNDPAVNEAEKHEQVAVVITKFQENLTSAQETLEGIKDAGEVSETVALAQVIDENVSEYKDTLEEVANDVPEEVKGVVEEAASNADEKGDAALAVIVEKHEQGSDSAYYNEVFNKVEERRTELEELIGEVDTTITALLVASSTDIVAESERSNGSATTTKDLLIEQQGIIEDAFATVEEVNGLIDEQKFIGSLITIKETKETVKTAREFVEFLAIKLAASYEVIEAELEEEGTATSTDAIVDDISLENSETTEAQPPSNTETVSTSDDAAEEGTEDITANEPTEESSV